MTELASAFHYCSQHLVVAASGKKDFPSVKLEERASYGPDIDAKVVRHTKNYGIG